MANIAQSRPGALTKSNIPVLETIKSLLRANKKPLHVLEFNHCNKNWVFSFVLLISKLTNFIYTTYLPVIKVFCSSLLIRKSDLFTKGGPNSGIKKNPDNSSS